MGAESGRSEAQSQPLLAPMGYGSPFFSQPPCLPLPCHQIKQGMMAHNCNPKTQEAETEVSGFRVILGYNEFKISLSYM